MSTDTHKYVNQVEQELRHSAFQEFSRDERRPAVLLLSGLVLAVLFFAIGLLFGRWTAEPETNLSASRPGTTTQAPATQTAAPQMTSPARNAAGAMSTDATRRFTLFVASFDAPEKAQPLLKTLQSAGYTDVRTTTPRTGETHPMYSILVGHFTQDEARNAAQHMHTANDPRLKNAKVIEEDSKQ
jgi:septal ring-binding cell division protein DamX